MNKYNSTIWASLYNTLLILISDQEYLESLENEIFDVITELEDEIDNGLRQSSLDFFEKMSWINKDQKKSLSKLKEFVEEIPSKFWDIEFLYKNEDWILAKKWSEYLFKDLGLSNSGWDSTGEKIIFIED